MSESCILTSFLSQILSFTDLADESPLCCFHCFGVVLCLSFFFFNVDFIELIF